MNINRNKIEEVLAASKLNDLIHKKEAKGIGAGYSVYL